MKAKPLLSALSLCAMFALAVPWLVPVHSLPWTGFHADLAMAVVFAVLAALMLRSLPGGWRLPRIAVVFGALAVVPAIQHATGKVVFAGDALLSGAYLLALSFSIVLGAALHASEADQPAWVVLGSFGIASTLSLFLALNQWLQLDLWSELALSVPPGARVTANVAQPNKLATLFAWGMIALWWFHQQRRVRPGLAASAALLLLLGIVMTRSRVGAMEVLLILGVALMHHEARRSPRHWLVYASLAGSFFLLTAAWTPLSGALGLLPPEDLTQRMQPGTRLMHWALMLDAISQRPLSGWGWQQVVVAQSVLAGNHPASGEVITYSHNLFLDLMVWNGVPVGAAVVVVLVAWFVSRWRRVATDTSRALMWALSVLMLHALLELPHGYATALLPAGLMMGAVEASIARSPAGIASPRLPRWVAAAMLGVLLAGLAVIVRDYLRIEQAWTEERMRLARIGSTFPAPLPRAATMDHLLASLKLGRTVPSTGMTDAELRIIEQTAHRFPGAANLLLLARSQLLNGNKQQADRAIDLICRTHSEATCAASKRLHNGIGTTGVAER